MLNFIKNIFHKNSFTELEVLLKKLYNETLIGEISWQFVEGYGQDCFIYNNIKLQRHYGYECSCYYDIAVDNEIFKCNWAEKRIIKSLYYLCIRIYKEDKRASSIKKISERLNKFA